MTLALRLLFFVLSTLSLALGSHAAASGELEDAARELKSPQESARRGAVQQLARLGGEEAWALVVEALEDDAPRVADEAQLVLAGLPAEQEGLLLGKHGLAAKHALTARRAAEVLGRRMDVPAVSAWKKGLRSKDARLRRLLLWSLERSAERFDAESRGELSELLASLVEKDKDARARGHALLALAALAPEEAGALIQTLVRARDPELRAACAECVELVPGERALELARRLAGDEQRLVRLRAYEAFARRVDREGPRGLAAALEREEEQRLSWHLVSLLQGLSGRKDGRNPRAWKRWADELPEDWVPGQLESAPEYAERTTAFVGLPLLSDRLSFLIDFSGSMWIEREGKTRKQRVDAELRTALEGLGEDVEFNLIPFTDEPETWSKRLQPASAKSVKKALDWFERQDSRGKGNYWDAMLLAMEDPRVDTLMVLGDGAPSGGTRWNLELIGPLFAHENRFRGVFVDALLIQARGRLLRYWEGLAERSGGRVLVVDL